MKITTCKSGTDNVVHAFLAMNELQPVGARDLDQPINRIVLFQDALANQCCELPVDLECHKLGEGNRARGFE